MRMEKINDHQVRFMINSQDLSEHNLTLQDLKYGDNRTTALFKEMLDQATQQYDFNKEELPIMVEAIPLAPTELLIIVSVVEDTEELDPHFSRFAKEATSPEVREAEENPSFFENNPHLPIPKLCILSFPAIDEVISFCKSIAWYPGKSTLYHRPEDLFHLVLHRPENSSPSEFLQLLNLLSEYGEITRESNLLYAYLTEHEAPVMENAVQTLNNM